MAHAPHRVALQRPQGVAFTGKRQDMRIMVQPLKASYEHRSPPKRGADYSKSGASGPAIT